VQELKDGWLPFAFLQLTDRDFHSDSIEVSLAIQPEVVGKRRPGPEWRCCRGRQNAQEVLTAVAQAYLANRCKLVPLGHEEVHKTIEFQAAVSCA
jgi:hypothetical protein